MNELIHNRTPVRSCFACRKKGEKSSMLRLVVDKSGTIWPDLLQKAPGRGAYLCMETRCFAALGDKRLSALRQKHHIFLPQWNVLQERLLNVLEQSIYLQLMRLRVGATIGRDAVMRQMWESKPLMLLLAGEVGQALVRQVMDAVTKRDKEGLKTIVLKSLPESYLAEVFQREKMSVVALIVSKRTRKFQRYCAWYERIKGSKVSNG